ncbi:MAG: transaldolase [Arcanobacterium sp.]|nr:transaldolase [Arcanobacterium sp.]
MNTINQMYSYGTSVWLDDLSRGRIQTGNLAELIKNYGVRGITTNPSIFSSSIRKGAEYQSAIFELAGRSLSADSIVRELTVSDVRDACDIFKNIYNESNGVDGRVSIEVDPRLAHETEATVIQAKELWTQVNQPNVMIKIPATAEGIPAIREATAAGISVNVTLIFSVDTYRAVAQAYIEGLEAAHDAGIDLSHIESVASVFVSRVDTEIDTRLEAIGTTEALAMRGQAGVANARLTYEAFLEMFENSARFASLAQLGAHVQRPLWASTGVKNPEYSPTLYVDQLVAANTVNTMPEGTIKATEKLAVITGDTITEAIPAAHRTINALTEIGIDITDVMSVLEAQAVDKFIAAWNELLDSVQTVTSENLAM